MSYAADDRCQTSVLGNCDTEQGRREPLCDLFEAARDLLMVKVLGGGSRDGVIALHPLPVSRLVALRK